MSNTEKLKEAFVSQLQIEVSDFSDDLSYGKHPKWDSVAHMALIAELENVFDIMLDTDDIIDMSSVVKAKEILGKHDVIF